MRGPVTNKMADLHLGTLRWPANKGCLQSIYIDQCAGCTSVITSIHAVVSADNGTVTEIMRKSEELLIEIQQKQKFHKTVRAIEHVFYATKCFFLYEIEEMNELEEILGNIDAEHFTDEELGALYGCQSVVWSSLNDFGMDKAVDTAKKAVEKNQDCALWHFILAKNLRRQRRVIALSSDISDMEKEHFEIAYAISKNHVFGVYYLQMRIESYYKFNRELDYKQRKAANEKEVIRIAKDIFKSKPTNYKILLKLARMFLRANLSDEMQLAKECLDSVEKIAPNNSTYLHYCAMLYQQSGDYKEAIKYYKKAAECNNFVAELSYIQYGWETGELEPLPHLLRMVKKYNQSITERQIVMLLNIAITYYTLHKDIANAAEYFLKALTIDPLSKKFKVYYKFLDFDTINISYFLTTYFCPRLINSRSQETCRKIKNLLSLKDTTDLTMKLKSLSTEPTKERSD
ncbi:uncharacterized protein LOC105274640 isoform X2 [Ooceraea biroi]|uniref:uncharacterized protein LOC105274640 isoform X2 n=1 Tax=Ooceraea biroi TaxID=2015173 RepID=UPI000F090D89|nr:uncharacterized protein LOC105274640 isoform X2 [Ooceraea biroi]